MIAGEPELRETGRHAGSVLGTRGRLERKIGRVLLGATAALLLAAGCVLWWGHGEAVFASYLVSALAWCF